MGLDALVEHGFVVEARQDGHAKPLGLLHAVQLDREDVGELFEAVEERMAAVGARRGDEWSWRLGGGHGRTIAQRGPVIRTHGLEW